MSKRRPLASKTPIGASKTPVEEIKVPIDPYKYVSVLGEGSFGRVFLAHKNGDVEEKDWAVKTNFVDLHILGCGRIAELQIMADLHGHPNHMEYDEICFDNPTDKDINPPSEKKSRSKKLKVDKLYFVMQKVDCSLHQMMKTVEFSDMVPIMDTILIQILHGLEYLHSMNIAHRDIKPDNILCNKNLNTGKLEIKIGDYGLGKSLDPHSGNTTTILHHYYRSPEIALSCPYYSTSVDMWSFGVLCFKLFNKNKEEYPFMPLKDNDDQVLAKIHQLISLKGVKYRGLPIDCLDHITKVARTGSLLKTLKKSIDSSVIEHFTTTSEDDQKDSIYSFITDLFNPDMDKRLTAGQAIDLPIFSKFKEHTSNLRKIFKISNGKYIDEKAIIVVSNDRKRKVIINLAIDFYNDRDKMHYINTKTGKQIISSKLYPFYTLQVWCSSLSLCDRWLVWRLKQNDEPPSDEEVRNAYFVCVYLIVKTISSKCSYSFHDIIVKEDNKEFKYKVKTIEELEMLILVEVAELRPYRKTIYEYINVWSDDMANEIVRMMTKKLVEKNGKKWVDIAKEFEEEFWSKTIPGTKIAANKE